MRYFNLLIISGFAVFLLGCATPTKMQNMVYGGLGAGQKHYDGALKKEVAVLAVAGGEETNPLWTSEISNEEFRSALMKSLADQGLFSENGKYQLTANLLYVRQPIFGLDMEVRTQVRYMLKNSENNKVVFDKTILSRYTATVGDTIWATKRVRLANEGSARTNIGGLLEELSKLKVERQEVSIIN